MILVSDCNLGYFIRYDCLGISEPRLISINDPTKKNKLRQ
ncbi:hypothetical protein LINPERPRIM_LOCUS36763 [Linum perenne]